MKTNHVRDPNTFQSGVSDGADDQTQPQGWQRVIQKIAAARPISWLLSHILYRMDLVILRRSHGRHSLTNLLTGLPVVTLTTRGAKSGKLRTTPLVGIPDGENILLIASNFGSRTHPGWYHNLRAHPDATLNIQGRAATFLAHEARGAERARVWQKAVEAYHGFLAYAQRARGRRIPIMILTPSETQDRPAVISDP